MKTLKVGLSTPTTDSQSGCTVRKKGSIGHQVQTPSSPQNPTKSEEYQRRLQGVSYSTAQAGHRRPKRGVANVANTQDSHQEQAPCT
eukprot:1195668-Prorocentrum_minimum.AAC.3